MPWARIFRPQSASRDVTAAGGVTRMSRDTAALVSLVPRVLAVTLALGAASIGAVGVATSVGASASPSAVAASSSTGWAPPVTLFQGTGSSVVGVSCVSAQLCVAVGTKGTEGIALAGTKTWATVVTDKVGSLASVSCLSSGVCEAVGESTSHGTTLGVTYRRVQGKWSAGAETESPLYSVSCGGTSFCAGVDNQSPRGHGFVFNGKGWSKPAALAVSPFSISCPTTRFCAAVSQSGNGSTGSRTRSRPTS